MGTLIYSPGVRVIIETAGNGIIDVTEDLERGSLTLREEMPSTFDFTLLNHRRKYDGVFTPNDLITVSMKRFKWVQVFSGYLDRVPFFSLYPRSIEINATCTLKRLKYRPWDPGSEAAVNMMINAAKGGNDQNDGGMREVLISMLTEVGQWKKRNIHIGQLPDQWSKGMEPLRKQVLADMEDSGPGRNGATGGGVTGAGLSWSGTQQKQRNGSAKNSTDTAGTGASGIGGDAAGATSGRKTVSETPSVLSFPGMGGLKTVPRMIVDSETSNEAITGLLSTNDATVVEATPDPAGEMALTGEKKSAPRDEWHARMKFPFTADGRNPPKGVSQADFKKAKAWWKNRSLLVSNPTTLRSVVVRAADWGDSDSEIAVSKHALNVLKASPGQRLDVRFAPDSALPGQTFDKGNPPMSRVIADAGVARRPVDPERDVVPQLPWYAADNLKPNVNAARAFVLDNWPAVDIIYGYSYRPPSFHSYGLALDLMVSGGSRATGADETLGNSMAVWFAQNPDVFGATEVIWMDRIITKARASEGWRPYGNPSSGDHTAQHRDHPHISFADTGQTSAGPMGNGWSSTHPFGDNIIPGSGIDPGGVYTGGGSVPGSTTDPAGNMLNFEWVPEASPDSIILTGYRALMNDVYLLDSISTIAKASMRSFMSGPNGDFIAWFPDYFGVYGTAARMNIRDMELAGDAFSITWDDSRMVTHQFSVGSFYGVTTAPSSPIAQAGDVLQMAQTNGIASVEFPELMEALFNISRDDPRANAWFNPQAILQRFGARPNVSQIGMVSNPTMEFWHACREFQKNWASQFSSQVKLTFMPEIWPGMLLKLETYGFQAYVEQVRHDFDFQSGMSSGFRTTVSVIAPSSTDGSGLFGLPRGGKNKKKAD